MSIFELNEQRKAANAKVIRLRGDIRSLHESAGDRALTSGEQERFDRLQRGIDKAAAEAVDLNERYQDALLAGIADGTLATEAGAFGEPARDRRTTDEARGRALRAIDADRYAPDHARQKATQLVEADDSGEMAEWATVAANPDYLRAYTSLLLDPERGHLSWDNRTRDAFNKAQELKRSMSIGTDASGGYMVPFALDPAIILTNDGTINPIRALARTATITTSAWHGITSAGVSAEWKAEGSEVADASPSDLAQPSIPVHMADAYLTYSIEAEQDIANLVGELQTVLVDAKERHEGTAFTTGSGSGQPKGVITAVAADSGSVVAPTTAESFAVADIYKVAAAVPARHLMQAQWLANPVTSLTIRQFASGDGANHAFWAELGGGTPPNLVGKPYHECSDMDGTYNPAATAHNYILLLGDWSKYIVVDRVGMVTEIVPHVLGSNRRPTGQRGLFAYWRVGGDCLDTNAFRVLDVVTAA